MQKISTTFVLILAFAAICTAQISVSLQYAHDFRQSSNAGPNTGYYNYYGPDYIIDCFNCGYYGNDNYKRLQNYNYGVNVRYKKNRFAFQLGATHVVRDFRIQVIETTRDEAKGLVYAYDQWTGSSQETFPLKMDKIDEYGLYAYEHRYLGITPEVQFFWANYDRFSSFIGVGTSFYEQVTSDANGAIYPVKAFYSTIHATFGFEQRIGQHFFVNFGGKYQHGGTDYAGQEGEDYTVQTISAFLGVGYSL